MCAIYAYIDPQSTTPTDRQAVPDGSRLGMCGSVVVPLKAVKDHLGDEPPVAVSLWAFWRGDTPWTWHLWQLSRRPALVPTRVGDTPNAAQGGGLQSRDGLGTTKSTAKKQPTASLAGVSPTDVPASHHPLLQDRKGRVQ